MGVCGDWDFAAGCIYGCSSEANCYRRRRAPAHPDSLLGVGARLAVAAVDLTKERDALRALLADQSRRIVSLETALRRAADVITTGRIVARQHADSDWAAACERTENEIRTALKAEEGKG